MSRLLLLLTAGLILWLIYQRLQNTPPHKKRAEYIKVGLGVLVVVVVLLTLTGRISWIGAALTGLLVAARSLLPVLIRSFPLLQQLYKSRTAQAGTPGESRVETPILRMILNHESGQMSGEVLQGPFNDQSLEDLDRTALDELMAYCLQNDDESARLLDHYLQRRFGEGARQPPPSGGGGGSMTRNEALAILGLEEEAERDAIVAAHRKLMQKLHPDRGGNDYLAAKVNLAKDTLLG